MIVLPRHTLPETESLRSAKLHEYFTEHIVSTELVDDSWVINLKFPDIFEHYVDPQLNKGLEWWGNRTSILDIPYAVRQESQFQLSLNDCWTILAWSQWLSKLAEQRALPSEVVLLHVDDHDDLMSPRIWSHAGTWLDAISGESISLLDPNSVSRAIRSGAIGIGSFIAPLLHLIPKLHVRHLCATGYSTTRPGLYKLSSTVLVDELINFSMRRIAVQMQNIHQETIDFAESGSYRVTDNPVQWLENLPDAPLLLHIDMDYFNNRFNRDSDWKHHSTSHNPTCDRVLDAIDDIFAAISQHEVLPKIQNIAIALSPGFFPAEFWSVSVERIRQHLQ